MSVIAVVNLVSARKLDSFLMSGCSWNLVLEGSGELSYRWSGEVLGTAHGYLCEHGIALLDARQDRLSAALEASCIVLTTEHRRFVDQLDSSRFDGPRLRAYYETLYEVSAPAAEPGMIAAIQLLKDVISRVDDGTVGVIVIG